MLPLVFFPELLFTAPKNSKVHHSPIAASAICNNSFRNRVVCENISQHKNKVNLSTVVSNCSVQQQKVENELSLVWLNDKVLLHVFNYLNWIHATHLAATCVRLLEMNFWKYKKCQEFHLSEYEERKNSLENILNTFMYSTLHLST